ncbi:hypothetical protein BKA70DRAFT_1246355 [Coprinopsis sp. MPI-PUGE-AT-0042]|nr:hypothetical protein BKA70DRAFT_1246355 [Coprinopsis sp. MPI-PUGE-AT-0042]
MGNTSSSERSSDSGSEHESHFEGPSDTPTDSVCTTISVTPKVSLLRYTPPPSELHLHLIDDVDPPAEFSSRNLPGGAVSESVDVEMQNGTTSLRQDKAPSTTTQDSVETLKVVETGTTPKNEVKIMLKIPSSGKRSSRAGDVNAPKHEEEARQGSDPPASASLRTSHYYPGRNAEESEQRFQRLLQSISDELLASHTLDDALESITKEPPGKSKMVKEDVALTRLHRIYGDFDELDWEIRLLNAGLMIGTSNHLSKDFSEVFVEGPVTLERTLQLDMALHKIRGSGGPYRGVFTDWVESLISTVQNLKLSEMWNAQTTRDRRRFTETAFDEISRLEQNNEWDSEEKAQEFKTWSKHQERMTVVRNQTWKLYKMFGATVLLEVNTFRPIFDGQPISRSVPFPPLIRHITTRFREIIKTEGDQLLIFQARYWEDDLEEMDVVDGEELWAEWVTRSHKSACRVIIPVVKAVAGEEAATWVSTFLSKVPPDVFIGGSDPNDT